MNFRLEGFYLFVLVCNCLSEILSLCFVLLYILLILLSSGLVLFIFSNSEGELILDLRNITSSVINLYNKLIIVLFSIITDYFIYYYRLFRLNILFYNFLHFYNPLNHFLYNHLNRTINIQSFYFSLYYIFISF